MNKPEAPLGRPREFDTEKALDSALKLFWERGYEGTSLSDLTEAMGINRPSLYAAFGNKEALFHLALERYMNGPAAYVRKSLEEPTARAVVERLLHGAVDALSCPNNPHGCMTVQSALACGADSESIRQELINCRAAGELGIRERFERAKREGDLPPNSNPADLARYITTVVQGLGIQASGGASREELSGVVEIVLRGWQG